MFCTMFIELTEILRCPRAHDQSYMICAPVTMNGRNIVRGGVSCPACGADYPILGGVAYFSPPTILPPALPEPSTTLSADGARTFLGLDGPGGYVLLVGAAGRLARGLAQAQPGVMFVALNPPADVMPDERVSVLRSAAAVPLKQPSVRGAIVGSDHALEPWLAEASAVVLPGLRVVVERQDAQMAGVDELARGAGVFVGQRRAR